GHLARAAPVDRAEPDVAVAVHPLAVAAAAAATVRVEARVDALALGLPRRAVDLDVVHLHVAPAGVVGELDQDAARQVRRRGGVVLVVRRERPRADLRAAHHQPDVLAARRSTRADDDG